MRRIAALMLPLFALAAPAAAQTALPPQTTTPMPLAPLLAAPPAPAPMAPPADMGSSDMGAGSGVVVGAPPPGMAPPGMAPPGMAPSEVTQPGVAPGDMTQPGMTPPAAAPAMAPAPDQSAAETGREFCEHMVNFHLADRDSVPRRYRRFLGIWSDASWDPNTCAALIVDSVTADGTASIHYIVGPMGPSPNPSGGVLFGTGIIRDGVLRFQNSDGSQYAFHPGIVDLEGSYTTPKGRTSQAIFKQTP